MKLTTTILRGVEVYEIKDAAGSVIARAHRIHVPTNMYSLVIGGRPAARGARDLIVAQMTAMVAKANA